MLEDNVAEIHDVWECVDWILCNPLVTLRSARKTTDYVTLVGRSNRVINISFAFLVSSPISIVISCESATETLSSDVDRHAAESWED